MSSSIPAALAAFAAITLAACVPAKPTSRPAPLPTPVAQTSPLIRQPSPPASPDPSLPSPDSSLSAPRYSPGETAGITFQGLSFDSRTHRLAVLDQPAGPGSSIPDSATAARSLGGLAAINAGFFTPEGAPLGLVLSRGRASGSWNSASSLGSGLWYESPSGQSALSRRETLGRSAATSMRELIQAGPMLIDRGNPVPGLDSSKTSARTLILWDGGTRWWIGCTSPCTLAALARATTSSPSGWPVHHALNLDGGRSSDLHITSQVPGGPITRRPIWNKPVRNFLVLLPR